ncbi:MAG: transposase [Pseudomonadota bacterium]
MVRAARILPTSAMLHIICRGNNGMRVFHNRQDFTHFLGTLQRFTGKSPLFIHNYVLMHTHFHLLAWVEDTQKMAKIMKSMLLSYYHYFRKRYAYCGHLWRGRFRSIHIESEEHWLQCGRYIELNPVYAGICKKPEEYNWTSYHYYAYGKENILLRPIMKISGLNTNATGQNGQKNNQDVNERYQDFVYAGINLEYQIQKKRFEKGKFNSL